MRGFFSLIFICRNSCVTCNVWLSEHRSRERNTCLIRNLHRICECDSVWRVTTEDSTGRTIVIIFKCRLQRETITRAETFERTTQERKTHQNASQSFSRWMNREMHAGTKFSPLSPIFHLFSSFVTEMWMDRLVATKATWPQRKGDEKTGVLPFLEYIQHILLDRPFVRPLAFNPK